MTTNRSRRQAAEEPEVPLVPRPEDDEYGVVEILDVMPPVFAAHDSHAQPPLLPVRKHSCSIISVLTYIASNGFKIYFDLFKLNLALAFIFMLNYLNIDYM